MTDTLRTLLSKIGAEDAPRNTKAGQILAQEGVSEGPELLRIRALPRRRWQDDPALDELVDEMTRRYKRPNAEDPNARLLPRQAVGLAEFELYGYVAAIWGVGKGKTLLSGLLPTAAEAKRPLLLLPATLIEKTRKEFKKLSKTWRIHHAITLFSYNKVSLRSYKHFLTEGQYDLVIADEAYEIKNPKSGRSQRIGDYCTEHHVPFVPMTGTPGDSTVGDYAHYYYWCANENSPLPEPGSWELVQMRQATDETVREMRRRPGALAQFSGGNPDIDAVRAGIGQRLEETPGFVYDRDEDVNNSLVIDALVHDDYSSAVDELFAFVRDSDDELPDGRVLDTPLEKYNFFATLNLGHYRIIDPPPPAEWRAARKAFRSYVNECLDDNNLDFETAGEVTYALDQGELTGDGGVYAAWREIEPSFKVISRVEWFTDEVVQLLTEWMNRHNALVWTPYPAFGRALAKASGRPFFHHGGVSLTHGNIEHYTGTDSVILSTQSNYMGRNLQDRWSKNLIVGGSAKADLLEQQIGRTHRHGQKADVVEVTFFVGSVENTEAIDRARRRARIDQSLGRNRSSKLLVCDWLVPETQEVLRAHTGPRWRKKSI